MSIKVAIIQLPAPAFSLITGPNFLLNIRYVNQQIAINKVQ